jgi:hypothetical protein
MDHTVVGLRAVVRALSDVVSPAVDPGASLATEQMRLSIDYIEFVIGRLEFLHDRELFELGHHLEMAKAVQEIIEPLAVPEVVALAKAIEKGLQALSDPATPTRRMKSVSAALATAIVAIVRKAPTFDQTVRTNIERSVVRAGQSQIAFERSWYLPLGFDPDPGGVRPLQEVMHGSD